MCMFFMLRPKKIYRTRPTAGNSNNTVTHASDFTGLRFSERIIVIILSIVKEYIVTIIQYSHVRFI